MNNKLILHTGSDRLETEYAEYIRDRVGAGMCTGLGELGDLSEVEEITCIFRYEYKNAALPEAVEDLFFERAGELAEKKVKCIGFGERSDGFAEAVAELTGMCGVRASYRFLKESSRIYAEHTDREEGRVMFVRELMPEEAEAQNAAAPVREIPAKEEEKGPVFISGEEMKEPETAGETPEKAAEPAEPTEEPAAEPAEAEEAAPAEEPALKSGDDSAGSEAVPESPATYMDEAALAEAVRAVIAESEETISLVTDEVSAEFPDEEEAEDEERGRESEDHRESRPHAESGEGGEEIISEADEGSHEEDSREAGGEIDNGGADSYDDWDPGKDSRSDRKGGQIRVEEPHEEGEKEPAGEILQEETVQEESAKGTDAVGTFSWELKSGEALKKYIRRANGEEPWPEEEPEPAPETPRKETSASEGKSYRFVDESVTEPEEAAYEPPLGLSDLEAMEAEEAAEEVDRRERRKERIEREEEAEEGIIARAAARILAFFRGSRDESEDLDFDDEERETKPGKDGEKSFFERLREDVGVYDEDEEDNPSEEPQGDYDEDDEEEFEDDADFSDSFEEDEDEDEF
ncbi:MAG: hypothetical protein IKI12_00655 [Lachnospiraceae bacterium]|nr:hypothetical protein [Lachnospiraceae bacterium]MBR7014945.1 hypothetical protein [Lachnospiraceae bacterium]